MVLDAESGKPVYSRNEKNGLNAASNVKLVTSAAVLALLGSEFRWKTAVLALAPAEGGRALNPAGELQGDLFLRASGDPSPHHPRSGRAGQGDRCHALDLPRIIHVRPLTELVNDGRAFQEL